MCQPPLWVCSAMTLVPSYENLRNTLPSLEEDGCIHTIQSVLWPTKHSSCFTTRVNSHKICSSHSKKPLEKAATWSRHFTQIVLSYNPAFTHKMVFLVHQQPPTKKKVLTNMESPIGGEVGKKKYKLPWDMKGWGTRSMDWTCTSPCGYMPICQGEHCTSQGISDSQIPHDPPSSYANPFIFHWLPYHRNLSYWDVPIFVAQTIQCNLHPLALDNALPTSSSIFLQSFQFVKYLYIHQYNIPYF